MADFKSGDVVRLKSGGPSMTVTSVGTDYGAPTVFCMWFDKVDTKTGKFPPPALELVPDDD